MNRRNALLLVALLLAASLPWLDRGEAESELALPVESAKRRPAPSGMAVDRVRSVTAGEPASPGSGSLPTLLARAAPERKVERAYDLFAPRSWAPPPAPVAPVSTSAASAVKAPPPLPFLYIGRQRAAGVDQVFLAEDEMVHVVQQHSVIRGVYRVEQVAPTYVQLTYLPMNLTQRIPTGSID